AGQHRISAAVRFVLLPQRGADPGIGQREVIILAGVQTGRLGLEALEARYSRMPALGADASLAWSSATARRSSSISAIVRVDFQASKSAESVLQIAISRRQMSMQFSGVMPLAAGRDCGADGCGGAGTGCSSHAFCFSFCSASTIFRWVSAATLWKQ